jgi:hypothetical protein
MPRRTAVIAIALIAGASILVAVAPDAPPLAAAEGGFEALPAPQRLLDTRPGNPTADGQFAGVGLRPAGSTLELNVANRAGLPGDVSAVVLNVTVTEPRDRGFVTVFPCGGTLPTASNLNYVAGQTVPNAVITKVSPAGTVCLYTLKATHLVVDAAGHFPGTAYSPLPGPRRLLDTRAGQLTFDGTFAGGGRRGEGSVLELDVAGRAGIPLEAPAVVLNVTVTEPVGQGFVTVYPCGEPVPAASNLNFRPGQTVANLAVAKVGAAGRVCLYTHRSAHLVVDASGVLPSTSFVPLAAPRRLLDTRPASQTVDSAFRQSGAQPSGGTLQLKVTDRAGIPTDASAVVLNVTAVDPRTPGFITAHPRGTNRPTASNLNHAPGLTVANSVIARVGRGGDICLFTSGVTHLVVDVAGWLTGPPPPATGGHCPSLKPTWSDAEAVNRLVERPRLHRVVGTDRIAVVVCEFPSGTVNVDAVSAAAWANKDVAPWFAEVSEGRYTTVFEPHPDTVHRRFSATDVWHCLDQAESRTGSPYTNVLAVGNTGGLSGLGGPGLVWSDPAFDTSVLSGPPSERRRSAYVSGGTVTRPSPPIAIHEIGHTLHWPHSYIGPSEYDNPLDLMSGDPVPLYQFPENKDAFCSRTEGFTTTWWNCKAQHTIAFNRLAANWMRGWQVGIHTSGRVNYTLDRPTGKGVQLVAFPDAGRPTSVLTIEARPALGRDQYLLAEGVAVHVVEQSDGDRRQRQAMGAPNTYEHVIPVGQSATVHGVWIRVLGKVGDGYQVTVSGSYRRPKISFLAESPDPTAPGCEQHLPDVVITRGCPE